MRKPKGLISPPSFSFGFWHLFGHTDTFPRKKPAKKKNTSSLVFYCGVFSLHFCVLLLLLFATPLSTTAGGAGQQAEGMLVFLVFVSIFLNGAGQNGELPPCKWKFSSGRPSWLRIGRPKRPKWPVFACPHGHKAGDADRWGKRKLGVRPGNGAPLRARAASLFLPCERGSNSHTDVATRPRLGLAL